MKRAFPSEFLTKNFNAAASQRAKVKHRKRPSPVSIRVSDGEKMQLQEWAGTTPISTYVKSVLFDGKKPRNARCSAAIRDYQALAQVLSALGRSGVFTNLDKMVQDAEAGRLNLSDKDVETVLTACAVVTQMRDDLVRALGLKAG